MGYHLISQDTDREHVKKRVEALALFMNKLPHRAEDPVDENLAQWIVETEIQFNKLGEQQ